MFEKQKQRKFEKDFQRFSEMTSSYRSFLGTDDQYEERLQVLLAGNQNEFEPNSASALTGVVSCQQFLANSVSRLPIKVFQKTDIGRLVDKADYRTSILGRSPDGVTTSFNFWNAIEFNRARHGNSFARIRRNYYNNEIMKLEFIPTELVKGCSITSGIVIYELYKNKEDKSSSKTYKLSSDEILHFKWAGVNPY